MESGETNTTASEEHEKEKQLILMVSSIVVLHTVCTFPTTLLRLLTFSRGIQSILIKTSNQLILFNHSINFWMYIVNHKWLRREAYLIVRKLWICVNNSGGRQNDISEMTQCRTSQTGVTLQKSSRVHPLGEDEGCGWVALVATTKIFTSRTHFSLSVI